MPAEHGAISWTAVAGKERFLCVVSARGVDLSPSTETSGRRSLSNRFAMEAVLEIEVALSCSGHFDLAPVISKLLGGSAAHWVAIGTVAWLALLRSGLMLDVS